MTDRHRGGLALLVLAAVTGVVAFAVLAGVVVRSDRPRDSAACKPGSGEALLCHAERYHHLARHSGVTVALATLRLDADGDDVVRASCHHFAHHIGKVAGERHRDLTAVLAEADPICGSGYFEGAVEAITEQAVRAGGAPAVERICAPLRERGVRALDLAHCAHAVGHGVMTALDGALGPALQACDRVGDERERRGCHSGVFMENVSRATAPDPGSRTTAQLSPHDPLQPCPSLEPRYQATCFTYQTAYALYATDHDVASVFGLCATASGAGRAGCYQGLGLDAAYLSLARFVTRAGQYTFTRELCLLGRDAEARLNCVVGAVREFIVNAHDGAPGRAFCAALDAETNGACLTEARRLEAML
jgi:hypothetical protein